MHALESPFVCNIYAHTAELDLKAFPPLFDGETEEQRIKRLKAYASSWKSMEDHIKASACLCVIVKRAACYIACCNILLGECEGHRDGDPKLLSVQEVLEATNTSAFQALAAYAFQQHSSPHKWRAAASRQRIIPTALAVAGSISAADHSETFPALVAELRRKVGGVLSVRLQNKGSDVQVQAKQPMRDCMCRSHMPGHYLSSQYLMSFSQAPHVKLTGRHCCWQSSQIRQVARKALQQRLSRAECRRDAMWRWWDLENSPPVAPWPLRCSPRFVTSQDCRRMRMTCRCWTLTPKPLMVKPKPYAIGCFPCWALIICARHPDDIHSKQGAL